MKPGKVCTGIGSLALFLVGILHGSKISQVEALIKVNSVRPPLDGIARACWLLYSVQMVVLATIAFVASRLERGGRIVFLCGLMLALDGIVLLKFLGVFVGVYLTFAIMLLYFLGAFLQGREAPAN
ncbi:MAG TPA: hypothetical protein VJN93_12245 [Candidatus Acidoferrum sp.]|nr:hypothetical protein [Candidatus Acidoferrum sp.]